MAIFQKIGKRVLGEIFFGRKSQGTNKTPRDSKQQGSLSNPVLNKDIKLFCLILPM